MDDLYIKVAPLRKGVENPGKATEGDSLYDAPAEHPSPAAQQNRHTWRKVGIRHYKDDIQRRFPFFILFVCFIGFVRCTTGTPTG